MKNSMIALSLALGMFACAGGSGKKTTDCGEGLALGDRKSVV